MDAQDTLQQLVEKQIGALVMQIIQKDAIIQQLGNELDKLRAEHAPAIEEAQNTGKGAR